MGQSVGDSSPFPNGIVLADEFFRRRLIAVQSNRGFVRRHSQLSLFSRAWTSLAARSGVLGRGQHQVCCAPLHAQDICTARTIRVRLSPTDEHRAALINVSGKYSQALARGGVAYHAERPPPRNASQLSGEASVPTHCWGLTRSLNVGPIASFYFHSTRSANFGCNS
jgi:hypothetical protein